MDTYVGPIICEQGHEDNFYLAPGRKTPKCRDCYNQKVRERKTRYKVEGIEPKKSKNTRWGDITPEERFWAKVVPTGFCWLWEGAKSKSGHGNFVLESKVTAAHRYAYSILVGEIPDGLHIDHLCRVRNCVNPDHLEPVTPQENVRRGFATSSINRRKTHCVRGHEYNEENTHIRISGGRNCRLCDRVGARRKPNRKRKSANM